MAGTRVSAVPVPEQWIPAFAGMTIGKGFRNAAISGSPKPDPGQLMLVMKQMAQDRSRDRSKTRRRFVVGRPLEFDRADKAAANPGLQPALDERQQPRRIADHVGKQP